MQAQLNRLAEEMCRLSGGNWPGPVSWQPAVNAYRLAEQFVICVDLAGMDKRQISVRAEPHRLLITGCRAAPEPSGSAMPTQVLALEINNGPFERVLHLPEPVEPEAVTAAYRDGVLWVNLPLARRTITVTPAETP